MSAEVEQGLKDKALGAARNVRRMKFIMLNANSVIRALQKEGLTAEAKKVQADIHQALSCGKDLSDVMTEIHSLSTTHLQNHEKIIKQLQSLEKENESEQLEDNENLNLDEEEVGGRTV